MKHEVHAAEPVDFELDIPDIEHFPLDRWEGQTINMVPGAYQVGWTLMSERKGKYKGCRIRTYRLDFADESPEAFRWNHRENERSYPSLERKPPFDD